MHPINLTFDGRTFQFVTLIKNPINLAGSFWGPKGKFYWASVNQKLKPPKKSAYY